MQVCDGCRIQHCVHFTTLQQSTASAFLDLLEVQHLDPALRNCLPESGMIHHNLFTLPTCLEGICRNSQL